MVDISRDARWGRVMEGAGEDPYLGSKIAFARVQGFQGSDLSNPPHLQPVRSILLPMALPNQEENTTPPM